MALTYAQVFALQGSPLSEPLHQRLVVALMIEAQLFAAAASPTAAQKTFAINALTNPDQYVQLLLRYVLAQYYGTVNNTTGITDASDATVQAAVHAAVAQLLS